MDDTAAIPTVEELTDQYEKVAVIGDLVNELALMCAEPAWEVRQKLAGVFTSQHVGVHYNPFDNHFGLHAADPSAQDIALVKAACSRVGSVRNDILDDDAVSRGDWIKVAYSPTIRNMGVLGNFFPGKVMGMNNFPGPLASTLTSGLLGAGLGYGGGALLGSVLPDNWDKKKLKRNLAMLGGAVGASPGLAWMYANVANGRNWNDNSLLNHPPTSGHADAGTLDNAPNAMDQFKEPAPVEGFDSRFSLPHEALPVDLGSKYMTAVDHYVANLLTVNEEAVKQAFDAGSGYTGGGQRSRSPLDVNINAMGQTLWDAGASPELAGQTMGALYAAQQFPSSQARPGWVTPGQMAGLAANMGAGYLSGALVGSALGILTGMPQETQDKLKQTGMYLGVVQSVVPRLFGQ